MSEILFNSKTKGYEWLSNMFACPVPVYGYPSTEHGYQAAKTLNPEIRAKIKLLRSAFAVKKFSHTMALRPGWNEMKDEVMTVLLERKFEHPELRKKLLATGDAQLIHFCPWGDAYWGVDKNMKGLNKQGEMLMKLRASLGPF